ncbi:hypothetical protein EW145_g2608 [Phellinidium pouzarii]|uniref:Protein arginine methyltransferase NDUFAF7 n=1 Tax=Phellinidium pouzarii TaxID=167371 RepID=A0A4S4LAP4_9AGAM|nr:hypothetical protein EW145_g2608 [Phellinidium pouzarii]
MNTCKLTASNSRALLARKYGRSRATRSAYTTVRAAFDTASARHVSTATPTKLDKIIRDSIKATGPMSVSTYMQLCLAHPTEGYYMSPSNAVFGKQGDFITSPEISQVFGELIAIWHLARWYAAGRPRRVRVVELGPGRGTLIADAFRTWSQFSDSFAATCELHLIETSGPMRALQHETLQKYGFFKGTEDGSQERFYWRDSLEDMLANSKVDEGTYTIVIAHEFFDALPVHVVEKHKTSWHEIQITSEPNPAVPIVIRDLETSPSPPFRFVRTPEPTPLAILLGSMSPRYNKLAEGSRLEVSPVAFKAARQIAELVSHPKSSGGSALIIDYGQESHSGNSLRAFKKHKIVNIFETPGKCDLTTNVDFAALKEALGDSVTPYGPITQHDFLNNMSIKPRVEMLMQAAARSGSNKSEIARAAARLVDLTGMGSQYKFLGIVGTGVRTTGETDIWPFVRD